MEQQESICVFRHAGVGGPGECERVLVNPSVSGRAGYGRFSYGSTHGLGAGDGGGDAAVADELGGEGAEESLALVGGEAELVALALVPHHVEPGEGAVHVDTGRRGGEDRGNGEGLRRRGEGQHAHGGELHAAIQDSKVAAWLETVEKGTSLFLTAYPQPFASSQK